MRQNESKSKVVNVGEMIDLKELQSNIFGTGVVQWISIRQQRRIEVTVLNEVFADKTSGLIGDRYKSSKGARQVTLIQSEHIDVVKSILKRSEIDPGLLRRNIVVSGVNLLALKGKKFFVGDAVLEYSGDCHPCSRMEENLGFGGYNAMRGHGGITARIIESGMIRVGDKISVQ